MVHMHSGGKLAIRIIVVVGKRFKRGCFCCPLEELGEDEEDDDGGTRDGNTKPQVWNGVEDEINIEENDANHSDQGVKEVVRDVVTINMIEKPLIFGSSWFSQKSDSVFRSGWGSRDSGLRRNEKLDNLQQYRKTSYFWGFMDSQESPNLRSGRLKGLVTLGSRTEEMTVTVKFWLTASG